MMSLQYLCLFVPPPPLILGWCYPWIRRYMFEGTRIQEKGTVTFCCLNILKNLMHFVELRSVLRNLFPFMATYFNWGKFFYHFAKSFPMWKTLFHFDKLISTSENVIYVHNLFCKILSYFRELYFVFRNLFPFWETYY